MLNNNIKSSMAGLVLDLASSVRARRVKATAQREWLLAALFALLMVFPGVMAQEQEVRRKPAASAPLVTASVTSKRLRFVAPGTVVQLRLEVYTESGTKVFDTELRGGNVLDWHLQDGAGARLSSGSYTCLLTIKSLSGRLSQRVGRVTVTGKQTVIEPLEAAQLSTAQQQAIGPLEGNASFTVLQSGEQDAITAVTHDGESGQVTSTSGDLSFRTGDFFSGKDVERMRITEDGSVGIGTDKPEAMLDVQGAIRARGGIRFDDGTALTSTGKAGRTAADGSITSNATGSGTQGRLAKWVDNAGTLGDSIVTELGNKIGIGATTPAAPLDINGASAGATTGATANGNLFVGAQPNTNLVMTLGVGTTGSTHSWIQSRHRTSPSFYNLALNPNGGNVGIGTIAPTAKLHLSGVNSRARLHSTDPNAWTVTEYVTNNQEWHAGVGGSTVPFGLNGKFYIYDETAHLFRMVVDQFGRVGIGTTNPTATLDVNGSIKISPTTRYKSIHGAAFMYYGHRQGDYNSVQPYVEYNESGVFGMYNHDTSNNKPFWTASVELPDGAVITEFCISAAASNVDFPVIAANLYKTNLDSGGTGLIARTFIAEGTTSVQNVCIDSNEIVNNNRYAYSVKVDMERGRLIGARIKYQVTQLP